MKKELATFLLLVVLCAIVTALNPRFLSPGQSAEHGAADRRVRDLQPRPGPGHHHRRHRPVGRIGVRPARRAALDHADAVAPALARRGAGRRRTRGAARRVSRPAHHAAAPAAVHRHAVRPVAVPRSRAVHRRRRDEGIRGRGGISRPAAAGDRQCRRRAHAVRRARRGERRDVGPAASIGVRAGTCSPPAATRSRPGIPA